MPFDKPELVRALKMEGFPNNEVVISFDSFFTHNYCESSIAVNTPWKPSVVLFKQVFEKLLKSGQADSVWVRVKPTPENADLLYSDTIYVIGKISVQELQKVIVPLKSTNIVVGWAHGEPANLDTTSSILEVYSILWD
jgi:hypothetical protein